MSDGTFRGRWIDEVFRTPSISDAVRVALLALALEMDEAGEVSLPRRELAERLARSERRMDDRIGAAIQAHFLERTGRGHRSRVASYQAILPDSDSATPGGRAISGGKRDTRGSRNQPDSATVCSALSTSDSATPGGRAVDSDSATPGGRAEGHPYSGTARAHSKGDRSGTTATPEADDSRRGGVVVRLFDEEIGTSLRSQTADLRSAARETTDRFDEFWKTYPRRVAKGAARKAWDKAIKNGADPEEVIWGARRYATDPRRSAADIRYTAHPATWLNAERWTDEDEPAPGPAPDPRQQATDDLFDRAMRRAIAREEQQ